MKLIAVIRANTLGAACALIRQGISDYDGSTITYYRNEGLLHTLNKLGIAKTKKGIGKLHFIEIEYEHDDLTMLKLYIGSSKAARLVTAIPKERFDHVSDAAATATNGLIDARDRAARLYNKRYEIRSSDWQRDTNDLWLIYRGLCDEYRKRYMDAFLHFFNASGYKLVFHDQEKPRGL